MRLFFWRRQKETQAPSGPGRRWTWLGGRRVLTGTPYVLPKDQAEGDRLDLQHYLVRHVARGNYRAPIRQPRAILDVATGTGIWAREMAVEFPQARVIGFDIDRTPLERSLEVLGPGGQFPDNFSFQTADALKPFPFADAEFDVVHTRFISPFVPIDRWLHVVGEMLRVLQHGGVIEIADLEAPPSSASPAYNELAVAGAKLMQGRNLYRGVGDDLLRYLQQAGASRVQQRTFTIGTGPEARRQQRMLASDLLAAMEHAKGFTVRAGLLTEERYERLLQEAHQQVAEVGIAMPVVFCFGTKL
jgi:ubiquinone/menaquinone biosynthesis C-methylase UbiE